MIITREKGMRMWGGGSGSTSASGVNGGGGFSLAVTEGEGTGNAYTDFTYESGILTLNKGSEFVTVDFFNKLFTAYDSDGNAILPNDVTSTINNLKLLVGTWTEEYLSALGKNSEGGGGGGVDLTAVWASLTNTDSPTYSETLKININHIPNIGWSKITSKPTTLAGYGITDAKIASGTITLGSNTITPLTASSSLAWGKLTGTPTTLAGYGIGDAKIANGVITLGSSTITPVTSVAMTVPTGFSVTGSPISKTGTLALAYATGYEGFTTALKEKIEALYSWFEVDANGDVKTKDTAGGHVRGLYSESFVSSLGKNSSSGGGGVDLTAVWASLTNTDSPTYSETLKININHIPNIGWSKITSKPTTLSGYGISDAYTKTQVDNALGGYLPLSGGTLTGNVTFNGINKGIYLTDNEGNTFAGIIQNAENLWIGARAATDTHHAGGTYISAGSGSAYISRLVNSTSSTRGNYLILDSGNYSSYALPLTGGTITGNLISTKSGTAEAYFRATNSNGSIELLTSTNRGVYDRTTTTWLIGTDGTNTWLSQGNVGIGTTSPAYKLDVVGSIRASNIVYVGTGGAAGDSYISSDAADNIYLRNSSGAVLVCDGNVVRRGTTLSDVTLGSSSYPWLAAYATTFYGALSGNATTSTTASKLSTTSKTAWGQTYWTSGGVPTSITGNLSDVGNITADYYTLNNTATNPYLKLVHTYNSTNYNYYIQAYTGLLYLGAGSANSMAISSTGQVFLAGHLFLNGAQAASSTGNTTQIIFRASNTQQVAISSNSSALIINPTSSTTTKQIVLGVGSVASTFGNSITCNGEVTASSDGRKKNIISNTKFNVKDIASTRSVLFEWNDGRDDDMEKKIHGGSIAQDWLGKADSFLSQDKDGWYSINYGALALCSAITIAKEVVKHDDEITRLKKEVVKLRERVAELEERRVA